MGGGTRGRGEGWGVGQGGEGEGRDGCKGERPSSAVEEFVTGGGGHGQK